MGVDLEKEEGFDFIWQDILDQFVNYVEEKA
jgi:hypothetical protein